MTQEHRNTAGLLAVRETMEAWPMEEETAETAYWMAEQLHLLCQTTMHRLIGEHNDSLSRGLGGTLDLNTESAKLEEQLQSWTCYSDNAAALNQVQRFAAAYCWTLTEAAKD